MYLVELLVKYKNDVEGYLPYHDSKLVVWGQNMEDLLPFANQWASECDSMYEIDRRYYVRLLKPLGTTDIVYSSWID